MEVPSGHSCSSQTGYGLFDCLDTCNQEQMEPVSSSMMLMVDLLGRMTSSLSDGGSFLVKLMKNPQLGFVIIFILNDIISNLHIR